MRICRGLFCVIILLFVFIYNNQRFHISSGLNVGRRHSYFGQPDYRIYELNKRLQQRTEVRFTHHLN